MKRIALIISLVLTIVMVAQSQVKNFIDQPYVEVIGSADTLITPNEIYIKITISERDSKDKLSVEDQENKMIIAFKKLNINTELNLTSSDMLSNYKNYLLKQKG